MKDSFKIACRICGKEFWWHTPHKIWCQECRDRTYSEALARKNTIEDYQIPAPQGRPKKYIKKKRHILRQGGK